MGLFVPPQELVGYTVTCSQEEGECSLIEFATSEPEEHQWILFPADEWFFPPQRAVSNFEGIPSQFSDMYGLEIYERGPPFIHYHLHTLAGIKAFASSLPRRENSSLELFSSAYALLPADGDMIQYEKWVREIGSDISFAIASPNGITRITVSGLDGDLISEYDSLVLPILLRSMDDAFAGKSFSDISTKMMIEYNAALRGFVTLDFEPKKPNCP